MIAELGFLRTLTVALDERFKVTMKPLDDDSNPIGLSGGAPANSNGGDCESVAGQIGVTLLELSLQARGAGLTTLAFLLEAAALEAGAACQSGYEPPPAS